MPTYEYECTRCGLVTEEFKAMSAPRRQRCPECRGKVERLLSGGSGILFKGSGFYVTDSRGKKNAGGSSTEASPGSGSDKGQSSGKDGKTKP